MMSDTESEYEDTNEDETDNEIRLKKRIISEAPPPYASYFEGIMFTNKLISIGNFIYLIICS